MQCRCGKLDTSEFYELSLCSRAFIVRRVGLPLNSSCLKLSEFAVQMLIINITVVKSEKIYILFFMFMDIQHICCF